MKNVLLYGACALVTLIGTSTLSFGATPASKLSAADEQLIDTMTIVDASGHPLTDAQKALARKIGIYCEKQMKPSAAVVAHIAAQTAKMSKEAKARAAQVAKDANAFSFGYCIQALVEDAHTTSRALDGIYIELPYRAVGRSCKTSSQCPTGVDCTDQGVCSVKPLAKSDNDCPGVNVWSVALHTCVPPQ
jgi:hypothetical protein